MHTLYPSFQILMSVILIWKHTIAPKYVLTPKEALFVDVIVAFI